MTRTPLARAARALGVLGLWVSLAALGAADARAQDEELDFCSERCVEDAQECSADCEPGDVACSELCSNEALVCRRECRGDEEPAAPSEAAEETGPGADKSEADADDDAEEPDAASQDDERDDAEAASGEDAAAPESDAQEDSEQDDESEDDDEGESDGEPAAKHRPNY